MAAKSARQARGERGACGQAPARRARPLSERLCSLRVSARCREQHMMREDERCAARLPAFHEASLQDDCGGQPAAEHLCTSTYNAMMFPFSAPCPFLTPAPLFINTRCPFTHDVCSDADARY